MFLGYEQSRQSLQQTGVTNASLGFVECDMATKLVSNYSPLGNFCLLYLSPWIFARTFPKMTPTEPFTCTLVLVLSAIFLAMDY